MLLELDVALTPRLEQAQAYAANGRVACAEARLVSESSGSPLEALAESATGEVLRRAHSEADIDWCARVDITEVVRMLVRNGGEPRHPVVLL